ncbi:MAG: hypothetical protein KGJ04_02540 [Gammaproteobacteria bacterium]|nr:hypothetical protein [Gammaproteobacteria bacterium]
MRWRSRTGGGGVRRLASMVLLVAVAALVMVTGLVAVVALFFAAAVVVSVLYIWSRLRRVGSRHRKRTGHHAGITLEGEYTVESQDSDRHDSKR